MYETNKMELCYIKARTDLPRPLKKSRKAELNFSAADGNFIIAEMDSCEVTMTKDVRRGNLIRKKFFVLFSGKFPSRLQRVQSFFHFEAYLAALS